MWNLEVTELIAIIFCTYILYLVISINSLYLDRAPMDTSLRAEKATLFK